MRTPFKPWLQRAASSIRSEDEGQGMVEYALILVLMAIAAIVSITLLGGSVRGLWETIEDLIITALEIR